MKKTWLYPAIAGIALLASACANNAAPNYTRPNVNQAAPHTTTIDGLHVRNFDGVHTRSLDGLGTYSTNHYNAFTDGMRPYNAFPDGTTGMAGPSAYRRGATHSIYQNTLNNRAGFGTMSTTSPRLGYAQTDRTHLRTASANNVYVDRQALAQAVGNVTASCPGVQRSTVLVTDEEIFVGLHTLGGDPRTAKNQARMNAMSVCPRYYKVYVTDNPNDIQEIARVASRTSNVQGTRMEDERSIDTLIKRMGGTVDGEEGNGRGAGTRSTHHTNMKTTSR